MDPILLGVLVSSGTALIAAGMALAGVVLTLRNRREAQKESTALAHSVKEVSVSIDGRLQRLLELTESDAILRGNIQGHAEGRAAQVAEDAAAAALLATVPAVVLPIAEGVLPQVVNLVLETHVKPDGAE